MSSARQQLDVEVEGVSLDAEAAEFCARHELARALGRAVRLARSVFPNIVRLRAELEVDPDSDMRFIVLVVTTTASVTEVLDAKGKYTPRWVASASAAEAEKIVLIYDVI